MVENKALDAATGVLADDADALPHYDLLQQSLMLQTGKYKSNNRSATSECCDERGF